MDDLEKFIVNNRPGFDEERNSETGWDNVRNRLDEKQPNWSVYWKVAAVIFFASTLVLSVMQVQKNDQPAEIAKVHVQSQSIEGFFAQQISLKKQEYKELAGQSQMDELLEDLENMDEAYIELNESFTELNDPEVAEAMLENLRLRILILNEQIEILRNGEGEEEFYHSS